MQLTLAVTVHGRLAVGACTERCLGSLLPSAAGAVRLDVSQVADLALFHILLVGDRTNADGPDLSDDIHGFVVSRKRYGRPHVLVDDKCSLFRVIADHD